MTTETQGTEMTETTTVRACDVRSTGRVVEIPVGEAFLIWSHEHDAWWGPAFCGYYASPFAAGVYTQVAAEDESTPWPEGTTPRESPRRLVDQIARWTRNVPATEPCVADVVRAALAACAP